MVAQFRNFTDITDRPAVLSGVAAVFNLRAHTGRRIRGGHVGPPAPRANRALRGSGGNAPTVTPVEIRGRRGGSAPRGPPMPNLRDIRSSREIALKMKRCRSIKHKQSNQFQCNAKYEITPQYSETEAATATHDCLKSKYYVLYFSL